MEYIVPIAIVIYVLVSIVGAVIKSLSTTPARPPVPGSGPAPAGDPESDAERQQPVSAPQPTGRPAQDSGSWFEIPDFEMPFGPRQAEDDSEEKPSSDDETDDFASGSDIEPDESMQTEREFAAATDELDEMDDLEREEGEYVERPKKRRRDPAAISVSWSLTRRDLRRAVVLREVLGPSRAKRPWPH